LPAAFERSKALGDEEAFQLWLNSYQHGFLTSDVVEASGAYRKKSGFAFNKKTKQEIAGRLGLTAEEAEDSEGAESMARTPSGTLERTVNDLPAEQIPRIREGISSGNIPILRDDHGEYLGAQGRKYYLDDAFKEGLEYTSRTEEEVLAEMIRNGIIPVIKRDNQEFLPQQNGLLAPFRPEQYGLAQGDYHPLSEQEYRQLQRDNLIRQRQEELDQMLQQREAEQNLPLAPRGEPSVDNTSASVPRII
jgi:hypothetical protein